MAETKMFAVGDLIELQIQGRRGMKYWKACVLDSTDDMVRVQLNSVPFGLSADPELSSVTVEKRCDDGLRVVTATIVEKQLTPKPILQLRLTNDPARIQRRDDFRLPTVIELREAYAVEANGTKKPIEGFIANISAGGVLLRSRKPLSMGEYVETRIELPGSSSPALNVRLKPLRFVTRNRGTGVFFEIGCRFDGLKERDRSRIVRYIYEQQVKQRQRGLS